MCGKKQDFFTGCVCSQDKIRNIYDQCSALTYFSQITCFSDFSARDFIIQISGLNRIIPANVGASSLVPSFRSIGHTDVGPRINLNKRVTNGLKNLFSETTGGARKSVASVKYSHHRCQGTSQYHVSIHISVKRSPAL